MTKPLEPPAPVYDHSKPRDKTIARCNNIAPLEEIDLFADCATPADRLQKLLDSMDELRGNYMLTRL